MTTINHVQQDHGPSRILRLIVSTFFALPKPVRLFLQRIGAVALAFEVRSLVHRISAPHSQTTLIWGMESVGHVRMLNLGAVEHSAYQLEIGNTKPSCKQGIRLLSESRPWLSLADAELFAQGWYQAARIYTGKPEVGTAIDGVLPPFVPVFEYPLSD